MIAQPVFFPGASGTLSCGNGEAAPAVAAALSAPTARSLVSAPARFAAAIPPPTSVRNFRLVHFPIFDSGVASIETLPQLFIQSGRLSATYPAVTAVTENLHLNRSHDKEKIRSLPDHPISRCICSFTHKKCLRISRRQIKPLPISLL